MTLISKVYFGKYTTVLCPTVLKAGLPTAAAEGCRAGN